MKPIETAAELHHEICQRGLELRRGAGRDDALIDDLAAELGLSPIRFAANLRRSGKSAEEYLRAFLAVAAPFAIMFREIWAFLSRHHAPKANERLVLRFGFGKDCADIEWEQFRASVRSIRKVESFAIRLLWPSGPLFELARRLGARYGNREYRPGDHRVLAPIKVVDPEDEIGSHARNVIQVLIDAVHNAWARLEDDARKQKEASSTPHMIPELASRQGDDPQDSADGQKLVTEHAYLLTDLFPLWDGICAHWHEIPKANKLEAVRFFDEEIAPLLEKRTVKVLTEIDEMLDLLELPFWRYRWHTYEVWAAVKALAALENFHPQLEVKNGHVALDAASPALVARLTARHEVFAHVQAETVLPMPLGKRKKIKPDLRFSKDSPASNDGTIAIVEFKQRRELDSAHALEVLEAYAKGVGHGGGVVLINYDSIPAIQTSPGCVFLGEVQPAHPHNVAAYQDAVRDAFKQANLNPVAVKRVVLLDVSGSMQTAYHTPAAQIGLKAIITNRSLRVYRFNDGLVTGGDLHPCDAIATSGGTQLGSALEQLYALEQAGPPERLLIVTDGEHDHPAASLAKAGSFRECMPDQIQDHVPWLLNT